MSRSVWGLAAFSLLCVASPACAGPPFLTDDPTTTDYRGYEILLFAAGAHGHDGDSGDVGVDFNYGAGRDLQLTVAAPLSFDRPRNGDFVSGVGTIEIAAKARVLHQEEFGWDVAVFPRLFVPTGTDLSDDHASLLLPVWIGHDEDNWSTFGGGGCALNRGGDSRDYCVAGWAFTRQVTPNLQLGAELFHETADIEGGRASTLLGLGATYDINDTVHFLVWGGAGLQNTAETGDGAWYTSVLFTF